MTARGLSAFQEHAGTEFDTGKSVLQYVFGFQHPAQVFRVVFQRADAQVGNGQSLFNGKPMRFQCIIWLCWQRPLFPPPRMTAPAAAYCTGMEPFAVAEG